MAGKGNKIDDLFASLRAELGGPLPNKRGIAKDRVASVLRSLDRYTDDTCDAVYALLDDTLPSFFSRLSKSHRFSDGATTAQIGCHVGILQHGKTKLDREGRDLWIKPLREVGAIEPITLPKGGDDFVPGHIKAKSPNSAYRLTPDFATVLATPPAGLQARLKEWASASAIRERLSMQAKAAAEAKEAHTNEHEALIEAVLDYYVPAFLPTYDCVYVDSDDGDRVNPAEREKLQAAGIDLTLADAYPDLMLVNRSSRGLWCAEAVTSDGEVDEHKLANVQQLCDRTGLKLEGMTTAYRTWRDASRRQSKHKNLAPDTYVWIQESGGTQLKVLPPVRTKKT